ncbi:MAG: Smr/MutS family protein [Verrucomicrobia subdivision 3 bacterium]|nr:Smr/MutS family protein [Limisphaerales bacterium]
MPTREIYIRKMRFEEARYKLDREINEAFMNGETYVEIVHGIGEGVLKKLVEDYVKENDFLKIYNTENYIIPNPGSTKVEILGIDKQKIGKLKR